MKNQKNQLISYYQDRGQAYSLQNNLLKIIIMIIKQMYNCQMKYNMMKTLYKEGINRQVKWDNIIIIDVRVIYQLNQMMTDGAKMIQEQGLKIDIINQEVNNSKQKVKEADTELKKASQVQQGNNGRMLFFCGIITLLVVIIVLLFSAGSRPYQDPNAQQQQQQN
ncbi:unnamed protein product [Paramecium primaurelia]|uniref:t-SNARE coiled-coil homology domain-containing protein n=1 Tax=Paramecium primaurelia TaxID=5886 RepID=A0A8S1MCH9_PARPR|nr:unnamed protein product [Paramecium primaurelia]